MYMPCLQQSVDEDRTEALWLQRLQLDNFYKLSAENDEVRYSKTTFNH